VAALVRPSPRPRGSPNDHWEVVKVIRYLSARIAFVLWLVVMFYVVINAPVSFFMGLPDYSGA